MEIAHSYDKHQSSLGQPTTVDILQSVTKFTDPPTRE